MHTTVPTFTGIPSLPRVCGKVVQEYQLPSLLDELTVLVEYAAHASHQLAAVQSRLEDDLVATLGIRANVELKAPGELERTQFKAQRVIDERSLYDA
mgnify:CR=1 FL=1